MNSRIYKTKRQQWAGLAPRPAQPLPVELFQPPPPVPPPVGKSVLEVPVSAAAPVVLEPGTFHFSLRGALEWSAEGGGCDGVVTVTGVSAVSTPLPLPDSVDPRSDALRVDVFSNFYGMPRELCVAADSVDTTRSVYEPFNDRCPFLKGGSGTTGLALASEDACLVTPGDGVVRLPGESGGGRKSGLVCTDMYWCRLFQTPSFVVRVDPVDLALTEASGHWTLHTTHRIHLEAPSHFGGWCQALENRYLGMFRHDARLVVSVF